MNERSNMSELVVVGLRTPDIYHILMPAGLRGDSTNTNNTCESGQDVLQNNTE